MKHVLVVDDEAGITEVLSDILGDEGYQVSTASDGLEALALLRREVFDCMLLDVWLPGRGGMDVLADVKREYERIPVVVISGHGTIDLAVRAVKAGAYDFLEKPLSLDRVTTIVRNAIEASALRRENQALRVQLPDSPRLVGTSRAIQAVRALVDQAAPSDARVLITGENGTGKELVARAIHNGSERRGAPFVAVNCAAIPDTLIETELFGHVRGAFTSAEGARVGKFELAHGGTLFLDEVADMSASAQAKVLRAVQEMRFEPVGGEESISVDVRILAATNRNLDEAIADGSFREDLFFRLNVIPIHMPSLRERTEDIPDLIATFLEQGDEHARAITFSGSALNALQAYPWPGNVRELKNFVERVSIMSDAEIIEAADVEQFLGSHEQAVRMSPIGEYLELSLSDARDLFERRFLEAKLRENGDNISQTARSLGMYPSGLHARIRKLGIEVDR